MTNDTPPRPGALRYRCSRTGEWIVTNPRSPLYSTATMLATEYYDSTAQQWKLIWPEEPEDEDVHPV